jgi:hypothetical protein
MSLMKLKNAAVLATALLGWTGAAALAAGAAPAGDPKPATSTAAASPGEGSGRPAAAGTARPDHAKLPRPASLGALRAQAERERRPIVALFSVTGCGHCEAIRRDQLRHLARESDARGVLVVEFDIADDRPFEAPAGAVADWNGAPSPAALARRLGVRVAPTLAFLGPGGEVAPRLVGYGSPDFFGAYLDDRIEQAKAAVSAR